MTSFSMLILCVACLLASFGSSEAVMSCSYGPRGSLTSVCVEATPNYFLSTPYRFDHLDETVRCVNCTLTTIRPLTFDISGNTIRTLDLTAAKISVLQERAFVGLIFMENLLMADNAIAYLSVDTFKGVNKLKFVDAHNNRIESLGRRVFRDVFNLQRLDLNLNRIKSIENGTFEGLQSLEIIDLNDNKVERITGSFNGLDGVKTIYLARNSLSAIEPADFDSPFFNLLRLDVSSNKLVKVSSNAFVNFPALLSLNLSSNSLLTKIEENAFRGLDSLIELDISRCSLDTIPKSAFRYLRNLRRINLSSNKLSTFVPALYTGLPELRSLNLSSNGIRSLDEPGVLKLTNLHTLDLSRNSLIDLDYKLLVDYAPVLVHLVLLDNPFPCYLVSEIEAFFVRDNVHYQLSEKNETCNETRPSEAITQAPIWDAASVETPQEAHSLVAASSTSSSDAHEYVLYIFVCVSLVINAFLFYGLYKLKKKLDRGTMTARGCASLDIGEARLIGED